jgi:hypothetical protein
LQADFSDLAHLGCPNELGHLFLLTVLLVALGTAFAGHLVGLSAPIGAFLTGMVVGESDFRHQVEDDIRPFRDVLLEPVFRHRRHGGGSIHRRYGTHGRARPDDRVPAWKGLVVILVGAITRGRRRSAREPPLFWRTAEKQVNCCSPRR